MKSPRSLEYEAIARVTHRLQKAHERADCNLVEFIEAIHQNRRLWTLFATAVADADNSLPTSLRASIFFLAEFVEQESRAALQGRGGVDPILDVNFSVMQGLRGHMDTQE